MAIITSGPSTEPGRRAYACKILESDNDRENYIE
jgi:hypothetical protein